MARHGMQGFVAIAGFSVFAGAPQAAQPTCDTSDANQNTACGTNILSNSYGKYNTGIGDGALSANLAGAYNTAGGALALFSNSGGRHNVAEGFRALYSNTSGSYSVAIGSRALTANTGGLTNVAVGANALTSNTSGSSNTATGAYALDLNTTGAQNTADGALALYGNTTGNYNSATGYFALHANTTGIYNAAFGAGALLTATTASNNTAMGTGAMRYDTLGHDNSATGFTALYNVTTGNNNTAIGSGAGAAVTTGNNNTYVGYFVTGTAGDNNVTRIGANVPGPATTYVTGIYNTVLSGQAVVVTASGQLGVSSASSERFKTDIATMGGHTAKLAQLRPVTFRYRSDAGGELRYGLVAEEVAKVYPELVVRDDSGRVDGVRYDELAPMLLNEWQKQQATVTTLAAQHDEDVARIAVLERQLAEIRTALGNLQPAEARVAQR